MCNFLLYNFLECILLFFYIQHYGLARDFTKTKIIFNNIIDSNNILETKNKEIKKLQAELKESKMKIEQLNGKIQELQTQLNIKNNSSLNKIKELKNTII